MRFNQLTIGGNLGRDAEVKTTPSGETVTSFSVAVAAFKKDVESTWFACSWWGEQGKKLAPYLTKGKPVIVSGEVSLRMYPGKDGVQRGSLEVRVKEVQLAGGRDEGQTRAPAQRQEHAPEEDTSEIPF